MDSSPRNRRSGRSQPQDQPALLPSLDLADWLKSQGRSRDAEPAQPLPEINPTCLRPARFSGLNLASRKREPCSGLDLPCRKLEPYYAGRPARPRGGLPHQDPPSDFRPARPRSDLSRRLCTGPGVRPLDRGGSAAASSSGISAVIPPGRQPSSNTSCATPIAPLARACAATLPAASDNAPIQPRTPFHPPTPGDPAIRRRALRIRPLLPNSMRANARWATKEIPTASPSYSSIRDLHFRGEPACDTGVMNFMHGMDRRTIRFLSVKSGPR